MSTFSFLIHFQRIFNYTDIESHLELQRVCCDVAETQNLTAAAAALQRLFWLVFISSKLRNFQLCRRMWALFPFSCISYNCI